MKARAVRKLGAEELYQYSLKVLAGRSLSISELRTRLIRRAATPSEVDPVLQKLKEFGFLNDARFAEGFASVRRESGSFGKARVIRDLRQRRVAGPVAESAVQEAFNGTDEP